MLTEQVEDAEMSPTSLLLERRERRLTQDELGRRVGISAELISMYERGHRPIRPERAIEIMRALQQPDGTSDDPGNEAA